MSHEFDLIHQFFKPLCHVQHHEIGIGDDGAVLNCPPNHQMVVVTDTMVENVHFPKETSPFDIGWKALAVNLSDLAAMGATPAFFSLALTLPADKNAQAWLFSFADGLKTLADIYQIPLIGGDTTKGPLTITVTAQGWVPAGKALLRSGFQVGEDIYVSGYLGEGGLGLAKVLGQGDITLALAESDPAVLKLNRPQPRVALGVALRPFASSAIDISDGFLADLTHCLTASNCSATLDYAQMPFSKAVKNWMQDSHHPLAALTCGDDYELCFTASPQFRNDLKNLAKTLNLPLTRVGKVVSKAEESISLLDEKGQKIPLARAGHPNHSGYQHF